MPTLNQGDVEITLSGETVVLRSTLAAVKRINAHFGDFVQAYRRVAAVDFSAFVAVIAAGLDKSVKEIEDDVFETGTTTLSKSVARYLELLSNGGRDPVALSPEAQERLTAMVVPFMEKVVGDRVGPEAVRAVSDVTNIVRPFFADVAGGETPKGNL